MRLIVLSLVCCCAALGLAPTASADAFALGKSDFTFSADLRAGDATNDHHLVISFGDKNSRVITLGTCTTNGVLNLVLKDGAVTANVPLSSSAEPDAMSIGIERHGSTVTFTSRLKVNGVWHQEHRAFQSSGLGQKNATLSGDGLGNYKLGGAGVISNT